MYYINKNKAAILLSKYKINLDAGKLLLSNIINELYNKNVEIDEIIEILTKLGIRKNEIAINIANLIGDVNETYV